MADVHLGNHRRFGGPAESSLNRRCRDGLDVFRRAVNRAHELKCAAFVVFGDLFDTQRPEPQLIAEVQRVLRPVRKDMQIIIMVGNHDQVSDSPGDHALGPLAPYATIVSEPTFIRVGDVDLALVPFHVGAAEEWLPGVLPELWGPAIWESKRVLGLHLGIKDDSTAPWLRSAPDAIGAERLSELAEEHRIDHVLAGNWHDRRVWDFESSNVFQLGALIPTGFDNPGDGGYGTLAILDEKGVRWEEIPGPRFIKTTGLDELSKFVAEGAGENQHYVSATVPAAEAAAAAQLLKEALASGRVVSGEVLLDGTGVEEQAREAAAAAGSASSLNESVEGFLANAPVEPGVDADAISAAVRWYLKLPGGAPP